MSEYDYDRNRLVDRCLDVNLVLRDATEGSYLRGARAEAVKIRRYVCQVARRYPAEMRCDMMRTCVEALEWDTARTYRGKERSRAKNKRAR